MMSFQNLKKALLKGTIKVNRMKNSEKSGSSINEEIFRMCLEHGFNFFSTLPGSYNVDLIRKIQTCKEITSVPLVREESGVALNAGAYLGGRKTAMVIQNQGLGNMEGQLLVLNSHLEGSYKFPNLYIISHRGLEGEKIKAQKPMGKETTKILDKPGIKQFLIKDLDDLEKAERMLEEYEKGYTVALTIKPDYSKKSSPNGNEWEKVARKLSGLSFSQIEVQPDMRRYDALSIIMKKIKDEFVISNMGFSSRELYYLKDRDRNFYLTSSLGQTYMLALGLALAIEDIEEKVVCLEGDGGLLMNLGSLTIVADQKPKNYVLIALDNSVYGSTGNIPTYTFKGVNLSALALACGFPKSKILVAGNKNSLYEALDYCLSEEGPFFVHTILKPGNENVPVIPLENSEIKERFMKAVQAARGNAV